jgi:hypothetical protein
MSVKCKGNLVNGQNRISPRDLGTYTICSTMRTGYEPPRPMSDKMQEVALQDAMA